MAPNIREWWRIPHLPTGEIYTISEDHTVMFEQIIEEYPEFLRNMHTFFSPLGIVPACMSNFLGRFTTLFLPKVYLIRRGLVSTLMSDHQIRELEVSLVDIDLDLTVVLQLLLPLTRFPSIKKVKFNIPHKNVPECFSSLLHECTTPFNTAT